MVVPKQGAGVALGPDRSDALHLVEGVGSVTHWVWGPLDEGDISEAGISQVRHTSLLGAEVTQSQIHQLMAGLY